MQHPITYTTTLFGNILDRCLSIHLFYHIIVILICLACNSVDAASQGKRGIQSSATVEISVTIHQTLNAISENNLTTKKPFCIANHGYEKNASVPYNLIVDRLESYDSDKNTLPFNIFLADKENKKLLTNGTKISKQSDLNINNDIVNNCVASGAQLLIEKKYNAKSALQSNTSGLLLLLVSPF
jgi:hypothetical protein